MSEIDFDNFLSMLMSLSDEQKDIVSKLCKSKNNTSNLLTEEEYTFLNEIL